MGMALQMKPGYVNPLTMKSPNKFMVGKQALPESSGNGKMDFKDLKIRQQQLQNELLLVKATGTDSSEKGLEKVKKMEEKLADVHVDLRSAKLEGILKKQAETIQQESERMQQEVQERAVRMDTYEHGMLFKGSTGIYGKNRKITAHNVSL